MKKILMCLFIFTWLCFSINPLTACADEYEINYLIYDSQMEEVLFERVDVHVGDIFIDKEFRQYRVYLVDEREHYAKVERIEDLKKIGVTKKSIEQISSLEEEKKIGLYMTHNDESYLNGDGTDSIYGKGGIHDVANRLAYELRQKGINIIIDETLHLPHSSSAYSRSIVTAKKLLDKKPNAIFDIHRDGVARSAYAVDYEDKERSQIRIVVGGANPNKEENLQFALYLMSVAESVCPWLFADIYYASGHYNQALSSKALLFEMGTYTMEKDLVLESVPYLANVINTTLFGTSVDEGGNLIIGSTDNYNTVDEVLSNENEMKQPKDTFMIIISVLLVALAVGFIIMFFIRIKKEDYK